MNAEHHRATAGEWASVKSCANDVVTYSTIYELLCRIKALEAAATAQPNHPEIPDGSLVDRVADAIVAKATSAGIVNDRPARAAIREVAAWLREHFLQGFDPHSAGGWAMRLEQEAKR